MLNLREVHKPKTLDEAIKLLHQPDTVVLAGGTELIAHPRQEIRAVVDLSGLGLAYIRDAKGAIAIGATTTLAEAADSPILRAVANGMIAQAAHRTHSNIMRNQATIVGTLIAEPDGIFATVLCAMEATLALTPALPQAASGVSVVEFLTHREKLLAGTLVTQVVIPRSALNCRAAIETVARTPRDKPIVCVCATRANESGQVTIAFNGVTDRAVRATETAERIVSSVLNDANIERAVQEALLDWEVKSDFRGSSEYRREMARILVRRALNDLV